MKKQPLTAVAVYEYMKKCSDFSKEFIEQSFCNGVQFTRKLRFVYDNGNIIILKNENSDKRTFSKLDFIKFGKDNFYYLP